MPRKRVSSPMPVSERLVRARAVNERNAAVRALDDPAKLARAARIVRAALERQRLTLDDLRQSGDGPDAAA